MCIRDRLYSAENRFFERLMSDFSLRTVDPHRALLYYIPTWLLAPYSNIVFEKGVAHYRQLVSTLNRTYHSFQEAWRANRSRFIFFLAGDKGACLWPRGPIYISHWGLTTWARPGS